MNIWYFGVLERNQNSVFFFSKLQENYYEIETMARHLISKPLSTQGACVLKTQNEIVLNVIRTSFKFIKTRKNKTRCHFQKGALWHWRAQN